MRPLSLSFSLLSRHNYYLPNTHHQLIPRVFYDRNKYRVMTESTPRPFTSSSFSHRGNYLRWSVVHHACRREMLSLAITYLLRDTCYSHSYSHQLNITIQYHILISVHARCRCAHVQWWFCGRMHSRLSESVDVTRSRGCKMIPLSRHWQRKQLRNELTLRPIRQRSLEAINPLCCLRKSWERIRSTGNIVLIFRVLQNLYHS